MTAKEKAKELINSLRKFAKFDAPAPPAQPPVNPADTSGATISSFNVDGAGAVFVDDANATIVANDKVYSDPAGTVPYPDGTYNVTGTQFGFTVAAGVVTVVSDAAGTGPGAPVAAPAGLAAPVTAAVPAPLTMEQRVAALESALGGLGKNQATMSAKPDATPLTAEAVIAMYAKFGTGNSNDRLDNLEIMVKALMDCNFGYQIRQGQEAEAVQAYKDSVATQVSNLVAATQKFESAITTITEQKEKIENQDKVIKGLFDLAEQLVGEPAAEPVTLNGVKKEKFERVEKKEKKFDRILGALKTAHKDKKY